MFIPCVVPHAASQYQLFKHLMVLSFFLSAMTQYHYGYLIDKYANVKLISYLLFVNQEKDMEPHSRKQEKKDKRKGKKIKRLIIENIT